MYGEASVVAIVAALNEEDGVGATTTDLRQLIEKPWILVVDSNIRASGTKLGESSGSSN
jgi:hypothetical protein